MLKIMENNQRGALMKNNKSCFALQAAGLEGNDDDDVMIIGESRIISKDKQSVSTGELRRK